MLNEFGFGAGGTGQLAKLLQRILSARAQKNHARQQGLYMVSNVNEKCEQQTRRDKKQPRVERMLEVPGEVGGLDHPNRDQQRRRCQRRIHNKSKERIQKEETIVLQKHK